MVELKGLYEELKFKDVVSYIQTGNIIFKSNSALSDQKLEEKIKKAIKEKFKLEVPVIIRSREEVKNIISDNPFIKQKGIDKERLHVTFLGEAPAKEQIEKIKAYDFPPDKFIIKNREVYLYCPNGYGISKLSNNFFENKLKVRATTRNWKTVNKLLELAPK